MRFWASLFLCACTPLMASVVGQIDNFEDGTTQGWVVNLLGLGVHPAPPVNEANGGPGGAGDNYLKLTSTGGAGAGNRLVALNVTQWAGNYTAAGIGFISMDLRNLGATDLSIRLYLENPNGAPPTDDAVTSAFLLPSGGGWTKATFAVSAGALTAINGNLNTLLSNVTAFRILHGATAAFPPSPIAAQLGVDNITALATPEPLSGALVALGLATVALRRRT